MRASHCLGVCVLLAAVTSAAPSFAAPTFQHDDAARLSHDNLNSLIQYEDAHAVDGNFNEIDPCWLINKQFFDSVRKSDFALTVHVEYLSNGHWRHVTKTVSLADVIMVSPTDPDHNHGTFDTTTWYRVRTSIDVSRHPLDPNTDTQGSIRMYRVDGDGHDHDHDHDCDDDDHDA